MSTNDRRAQVLFAPEQYQSLESLALRQKRSVGSVVREAVDDLLARQRDDRVAALTIVLAGGDGASEPALGPLTVEQWRVENEDRDRGFDEK
ncbi:MAG: hypothetical protein LBK59_09430 [Bifidobacteriaceae bacterium]|jgi:hypothetical protein|nr:hypothetical protein [Bifidobacteriaceae bacterium]